MPGAPDHDFSLAREPRSADRGLRVCAHPDCRDQGTHPAPRGAVPGAAGQWMCRRHARERNLDWNYFGRMSTAEIDAARRAAMIWNRPTWPAVQLTASFGDPRRTPPPRPPGRARRAAAANRSAADLRALRILGLSAAATPGEIRRRFRKLLRRLHPDLNSGRHVDATRLRAVLWAWRRLQPANPSPAP